MIRSNRLLNNLKHPEAFRLLCFFSDGRNFNLDRKVNQRNDKWSCSDPKEVTSATHTKFPSTVMVLAVISNEGHVMRPHFFSCSCLRGVGDCREEHVQVSMQIISNSWIIHWYGDSCSLLALSEVSFILRIRSLFRILENVYSMNIENEYVHTKKCL